MAFSASQSSGNQPSSSKKECNYGENCYRRNPVHFKEFAHSQLERMLLAQKTDDIQLPNTLNTTMDRSVMLEQLKIMSNIRKEENAKCKNEVDKNNDCTNESKGNIKTPSKEGKERCATPVNEIKEKVTFERKERSTTYNSDEPESKKRKTEVSHSGGFLRKWKDSCPYNFFLTKIRSSPRTNMEDLSISFRELLDGSLGTIESSLQINFMVELDWLLNNYERTGNREKPLLILYGVEDDALKDKKLLRDNVKAFHVKPPHPFGHHHTKMSIIKYDDGSVRVIVHTANLIESDWDNRTQGVWVGPRCPRLSISADSADGESPTNFRADLLRYLCAYKLSCLQEWVGHLRKIDFSPVKVCFVSSVPGSHKGPDLKYWGHMKAGHLLRTNGSRLCRGEGDLSPWPLIIQCSSVGSLGANSSTWMCGEFRCSLSETASVTKGPSVIPNLRVPSVKVIYPSLKNVSQSHDGLLGGACLPYSLKTHVKQTWFSEYLHQWKSENRYRSRAVPHIKTYMRWCPGPGGGIRGGQLAWFLLTSANLSKAAWGSVNKAGSSLYIMSYEAGILFLPRFFASQFELGKPDYEAFPLSEEPGHSLPPFPIPYDLPLTPYGPGDKVWQMEYLT